MLAKVIGHGRTRDDARRVLAGALSRARLHGVVTNRDLLVAILRDPEFAAGAIDTGYLTRHPPEALCPPAPVPPEHALAVALADQGRRRQQAPVLNAMPSGWRNNPSAPQRVSYTAAAQSIEVSYAFTRDALTAEVDGVPFPEVRLNQVTSAPEPHPTPGPHPAPGSRAAPAPPPSPQSPHPSQEPRQSHSYQVDLEIAGVRRIIEVLAAGGAFYVDSALGHSVLTEVDRFPNPSAAAQAGSLLAPMPGTVVRVEVAVGDHVMAGATILALEAMKMEHAIRAPAAGVVADLPVAVGTQVDSGSVLAVLDDEGDSGD
jgi:acetyl/propionyl-CoA carboxylase alpha subunit